MTDIRSNKIKYPLSLDPQNPTKLAILDLPNEPGIYIIHFEDGSQYVGEAVNLRKRWLAYRNALTPEEGELRRANGDSRQQWTNIRLKALICDEVRNGRAVYVEAAFSVVLDNEPLDLTDKHERKTAEGIVLARKKRRNIKVHNG